MKFRNLLMTMAFLLAVTSVFAIKSKSKGIMYFSYKIGSVCYVYSGNTDQAYCNESLTGPQCTYQGDLIYFYDVTTSLPPTCTVPLRRPF